MDANMLMILASWNVREHHGSLGILSICERGIFNGLSRCCRDSSYSFGRSKRERRSVASVRQKGPLKPLAIVGYEWCL